MKKINRICLIGHLIVYLVLMLWSWVIHFYDSHEKRRNDIQGIQIVWFIYGSSIWPMFRYQIICTLCICIYYFIVKMFSEPPPPENQQLPMHIYEKVCCNPNPRLSSPNISVFLLVDLTKEFLKFENQWTLRRINVTCIIIEFFIVCWQTWVANIDVWMGVLPYFILHSVCTLFYEFPETMKKINRICLIIHIRNSLVMSTVYILYIITYDDLLSTLFILYMNFILPMFGFHILCSLWVRMDYFIVKKFSKNQQLPTHIYEKECTMVTTLSISTDDEIWDGIISNMLQSQTETVFPKIPH